uniref:Uncharacterized protein n=1 Tax=Aegilops tauschii subsp. strangulata TaxID=200361 RepID=A0A452XFG4_AEGTS
SSGSKANSRGSDSRTTARWSPPKLHSPPAPTTMVAHALLTVPHATAGPRLAAPLFTPAATSPSLCRANCRSGSLTNQQQRLRHLHPAAAATKPGAIEGAPRRLLQRRRRGS